MKRALAAFALLAGGCSEVTLSALTVPPPGKTAHLDDEDDTLDLSRGIAIGFECTGSDDGYYGPCRDAKVYVDDPEIAAAYTSFMDTLAESYNTGHAGARAKTAFVIVGLQPGKTQVTVDTKDGNVTLDVTVTDD